MKYTMTIDVDEMAVKAMSGIDDLEGAIMHEAGWLSQSGISVLSLEAKESESGSTEEYSLTKQGIEECERYVRELKAKRKEILDAGLDSAEDTNIPTVKDIEDDISFEGVDEDGDYFNSWGVTDNYNAGFCIVLSLGKHFVVKGKE